MATLEGLLNSGEDTCRTVSAACLGTLCTCLTDDELSLVLNMQLLGEHGIILRCSNDILYEKLLHLPYKSTIFYVRYFL